MNTKSFFVTLLLCFSWVHLFSTERVAWSTLVNGGWEQYTGRTITIDTPLTVIGIYYDSLILAPQRLYCPEEHATGLASGDSTIYYQLAADNQKQRVKLCTKCSQWKLRIGCVVRSLTGQVSGKGAMVSGKTPHFAKTKFNTRTPKLAKHDLLICCANIQNYFYHLGGYASKRTTPKQFALQTHKIALALHQTNADLYALCELERGSKAIDTLVHALNTLAKKDIYAWVDNGFTDADMLMVGYIYRKDKIHPYGDTHFAVQDTSSHYHYRMMLHGFELNNGKRLVVGINHLRSKHGTPVESNRKRMLNTDSLLTMLRDVQERGVLGDEDILLVGDYNCHTQEQPLQTIIQAGYEDVLMQKCSNGYSYVFGGESGFLDRVFANPSMAKQIVDIVPWHINADAYYSRGFKSRYADPGVIRYADHDPLLVGITLK